MAIKYVYSGASGANDGTSWTNAWTSLSSSTSAAAGDTIYVHKTHSQTYATNTTLNWSNGTRANPVKIFVVDKDASDALATGAVIQVTDTGVSLTLNGFITVYGLTTNHARNLDLGAVYRQFQRWESCTFASTFGSSAPASVSCRVGIEFRPGAISFVNCTWTSTNDNPPVFYGDVECYNCVFTTGATGRFVVDGENPATVLVVGSDLSATAALYSYAGSNDQANVVIRGCKIHASYTVPTPQHDSRVLLERCTSGTLSVSPLGLSYYAKVPGTIQSSLSRYRTGGADDGEQANPHSWEMVSNANALEQVSWLESPDIEEWIEAGASQTVTLYLASGFTAQNDEVWVELFSPNETASPNTTAQERYQTSRLAFRGTAADLTTDGTSTWTGTGVGTKQKVSFTVSPAVAGPVRARVCLAKASSTIYVDPALEIA